MSVARPLRCLLSRRFAASVKPATAPICHTSFHSSARLDQRKRPRFKSIRAEEMGLTTPEKLQEFTDEHFKPYTPEEIEVLRRHYTPEQMEALEAGEASIDPKDLTIQGRLRKDPYKLPYLDDFSRIMPVIDKRPKKAPPPNPSPRWMTDSEADEDMQKFFMERLRQKFAEKMPGVKWSEMGDEEFSKALEENKDKIELDEVDEMMFWQERSMVDHGGQTSDSALAPGLGKEIPGVSGMYKAPIDPEDMGLDDEGIYQDLKKRTGLSVQEIVSITCKILVVRLVHNQTRLGKIRSVWCLAIAGNGNGRLGIGEAKSVENGAAVLKAKLEAIRNMKPIPRYEHRTIYGSVEGKFGATIVKLDARPPGFGLRASHRLFEMFRAVGIHDIAAKMPRQRNPMNSVKACFAALMSQKDPNEIAIGRGKKLVDVRKVYYGNNVF